MAKDPQILAHQEWLGYVQPIGLVVSIPALIQAQANVDRGMIPQHQKFLDAISPPPTSAILDFPTFVETVFGWREQDLIGRVNGEPLPATLEVALPEYGEVLRPTYALREDHPADPAKPWLMLIQELSVGNALDANSAEHDRQWQASPQSRMERLLRETQVPIGLLVNGTDLRLVYAPRGENSGYLTFNIGHMATVAGRPIFAALHMLFCADRLFTESPDRRLPALLANSRKYQSLVSNQLAEQVLAALYELVRGFQAADEVRQGDLLRDVLKDDPNQVYGGLLTVLMRLVFVLYAEDRGLISTDATYTNHYSVTGLFDRLRADAGRYPDTMDQRFGAWAQLLTLFRLIYDGGAHGGFSVPAREGYLFDPDRYSFLEGRAWRSKREPGQRSQIPRVPDGVVYRVLQNLLILDGERLSYRTLDVEQIGSVYETMMGFNLEIAQGQSIAIKPAKAHGAPATINLEALLATDGGKRVKWLADNAGQKLTGQAAEALSKGKSVDELLVALDKKIAKKVTPNTVPKGVMVLQPSDERRKSGSHYTPRSLTEPIVRKALEPILKRFGEHPQPKGLLDLKICDPAMGSGAFLVEVCRQLGDELVRAWHHHKQLPKIPADEDEVLHARRLLAQRCIYGVDRNPMAVDLAKLSLWLATLAKNHPFTFLDHNLRHGDSLVGLTRQQIEDFTWEPTKGKTRSILSSQISDRIDEATRYRKRILDAGDALPTRVKLAELSQADASLDPIRFFGNLVIAAFFSADKDKARKEKRGELLASLTQYLSRLDIAARPREADHLRVGNNPLYTFHWDIEFPEVFSRANGGFDTIVGNPPFAGKNTLINGNREHYLQWLQAIHDESHGNADLVAHFFRSAFNLLRQNGTFGLIATNTIGQGDTRSTGLRWICSNGGTIYAARKRYKWPGMAAVVVSVVHSMKGTLQPPYELDGYPVNTITAYLFHAGGHNSPASLQSNSGKSFIGSYLLGMGFTFDDSSADSLASPISVMRNLIAKDQRNADKIFPYIGGEEVNESPTHAHQRYVINFGDMTEEEARKWPDLMKIVEERVKPQRLRQADRYGQEYWWKFLRTRGELQTAARNLERLLVCSRIGNAFAFTYMPRGVVLNEKIVVFPFDTCGPLAVIQSRIHEVWTRFFSSTLRDDLQYTPSDCFETFAFPQNFETDPRLECTGQIYYGFRAGFMMKNDEGLTKTYNRFHDRDHDAAEPNKEIVAGIQKLRELHAAMDRAVLDAYDWTDIPTDCDFFLDYEEEDGEDADTQPSVTRRKKKPWRYRWPDAVRDEVLARLLALNAERAKAEQAVTASTVASKKSRKSRPNPNSDDLFQRSREA